MTTTTAFDVTMPQLGETVSEGTVIDWLISIGGEVIAGDALLEVSTDKVDTELPSPASGVLTEILATAGETVAVGAVIGRIAVDGDAAPPAAEPTPQPARAPVASPALPTPPAMVAMTVATTAGDRLRVSPVARRLADERRIDLNAVVGTGPDGAIVKRDVPLTAALPTAEATLTIAARRASSITAQADVDVAGIIAAATDHHLAAFIIRALVDSLRHEATSHPALATFVEPGVRYVRASTGQSAALPDAAGLRLSALTSRLTTFADDTALDDTAFDATVTILDSSDQSCAVSGAMSSAMSVSIGPRQTKPTIATSGTGVAIVFSEMVDVSVTVDQTLIPVQALTALMTHLKRVLETRDWSTEA